MTITAGDLREGAALERDGMWFRIDIVRNDEVYFLKGQGMMKHGIPYRMPVTEFVRQFNLGKQPVYCTEHIHQPKVERECGNCGGEGYTSHDCGEDCCCCADPENNVACDVCRGRGTITVCPTCVPEEY